MDQLRVVGQLEHRGRMPAPDDTATHLRSHDTHACAGADSPSDAVRPYGAARAGADISSDPKSHAAPDLIARARADASASAGADAAPDLSAALSTADALAQPAADANPYA